jgi:hypothetical protein
MTFHHHTRRLTRVLAVGLTAGAVAAPSALAGPVTGPDGGNGAPAVTAQPDPPPVIVRTVNEGFDVGSAAIGAGGAGALLVLVSLGGFAWVSRHPRSRLAH